MANVNYITLAYFAKKMINNALMHYFNLHLYNFGDFDFF